MNWLIGVIALVFVYWLVILRPGRMDFWKVVSRNPDAAYEHFKSASCWKVFEGGLPADYRNDVPKSEWMGPFRLCVPKLGWDQVVIFGKRSECEQSQSAFVQRMKRSTSSTS